MHAIVHGADIQDRDGGALLMATLFGAFPFLLKLYADGGYQGAEFQAAAQRTKNWPRKSGQVDKWIFCLTPATLAEDQEIR